MATLFASFTHGLRPPDQRFFELAANLIPLFFLAGTIAAVVQVSRFWSQTRAWHVVTIVGLAVFVIAEITAELAAIGALVSGQTTDAMRYIAGAGIILGIVVAGVSLLVPWVVRFYLDGRDLAVAAILGLALVGVAITGGATVRLFDAVFRYANEERAIARAERTIKVQGVKYRNLDIRYIQQLWRLEVRFAHLCRLWRSRGLKIDENLALGLVEYELRVLIHRSGVRDDVPLEKRDDLSWIHGACRQKWAVAQQRS